MFVPSRGQMGDLDRSVALMQAVCNNCRADLLAFTDAGFCAAHTKIFHMT